MEDAALAAIHAGFSIPVVYLAGVGDIALSAVRFHASGDDPFGDGGSVRRRGYEIRQADLAARPANGHTIRDGAIAWRIIDVIDYDEAGAWRVMVERA